MWTHACKIGKWVDALYNIYHWQVTMLRGVFLNNLSEAFSAFKRCRAYAENQTGKEKFLTILQRIRWNRKFSVSE